MTKEEFCAECGGECCNIYDLWIKGDEAKQRRLHGNFFKDKDKFEVEPLKRVNGRCEYLGESGCIINRENRPEHCLKYECRKMKKYFYGEKVEAEVPDC